VEAVTINKSITLTGTGADQVILEYPGDDQNRTISIDAGSTVTNKALTVTTANFGGGIQNVGNLTLVDTVVTGNSARYGAGIPN